MPPVNIYLPDDLHQAVKAAGFNLSAICQAAVRAELRREQRMQASTMELVELAVGGVTQRFVGSLLSAEHPLADFGVGPELRVYATKRGQIAVFRDLDDELRNTLTVFSSLSELEAAEVLSADTFRGVLDALDDRRVEDLDI